MLSLPSRDHYQKRHIHYSSPKILWIIQILWELIYIQMFWRLASELIYFLMNSMQLIHTAYPEIKISIFFWIQLFCTVVCNSKKVLFISVCTHILNHVSVHIVTILDNSLLQISSLIKVDFFAVTFAHHSKVHVF